MKVKVEQEHIDAGRPLSAHFCALALACEVHDYEHASVHSGHIFIRVLATETLLKKYKLPPEACEWYRAFDSRDPVKPIEFEATEVR